MSRRLRAQPQVGVSLFPFLAVLLCTMGALIVLLLLVMQQARVEASTFVRDSAPPAAPQPTPGDESKLRLALDDALWRRETLEKQRLEHAQNLSSQRLELAHLEEHIRRLQDQWSDLEAQAAALVEQGDAKTQSRARIQEELSELQQQLARAKEDLQAARQRAAARPKSYSIIPYQGPNGTSRRPIYIECVGEEVIIQPEGLRLEARDFEGHLGPGNPLDACLRAIREYLARNPDALKQGEPYPLLVVRPSGVLPYAAARAAMKSWDDEFGYELIEEETRLAYPAPDPSLRALLERVVKDARLRQDALAAAAPSRYRGTNTGQGLRASPHGGFRAIVPVESYDEGDLPPGAERPGIGRGGGNAFNENYVGSQMTKSAGSGRAAQAASGQANELQYVRGGYSSASARPGEAAGGAGGATKNQGEEQSAASGNPASRQRSAGSTAGQPGGSSTGQAKGSANAQPLASKKGANWGLPNYSPKATGITRPIRIRIEEERLLLLPPKGDNRPGKAVAIDDSLPRATEQLVSDIWSEVDQWGLAVANGYWKPILYVDVAPGAEPQFEAWTLLLEGSGLEIRRRSP